MTRFCAAVIMLLTSQVAWALDAQPAPPPVVVVMPANAQLKLPRLHARRELWASLGVGATGVVFTSVGGALLHAGGSAPISTITIGAISSYAALLTATHGLAYDQALRAIELGGASALADSDARGRRGEIAGITMVAVGVAMFAVGAGLTVYSLRDACIACEDYSNNRPSHPDAAAEFAAGLAISIIGDATWFTGSFVWAYGSGVRSGVREARGWLRAGASGLSGTF